MKTDLLRWPQGGGWLMLIGGGAPHKGETLEVDRAALGITDLERPLAIIPTASGSLEYGVALLEYFKSLAIAEWRLLEIYSLEDAQKKEYADILAEAALIYFSEGNGVLLTETLRDTLALEAIAGAHKKGATVVGNGGGATAFGAWVAPTDNPQEAIPGWGWIEGSVIVPHQALTSPGPRLKAMAAMFSNIYGLAIAERTALILGPYGEIGTIGKGRVYLRTGEEQVVV